MYFIHSDAGFYCYCLPVTACFTVIQKEQRLSISKKRRFP